MSIELSQATLLHASLAVTDLPAAAAFFTDVLGYGVAFEAHGMSDQIARMTGSAGLACDLVQLARPDEATALELIAFRPSPVDPTPPRVPAAHVAFAVRDLDAALARATEAGARLLGEVVAFSEGRSAYLAAPGGVTVEFEELCDGTPA